MLNDKPGEKEVIVSIDDDVRLNAYINRESAASFILSILDNKKYYKKIIGISN
jgi:hypothetical protein